LWSDFSSVIHQCVCIYSIYSCRLPGPSLASVVTRTGRVERVGCWREGCLKRTFPFSHGLAAATHTIHGGANGTAPDSNQCAQSLRPSTLEFKLPHRGPVGSPASLSLVKHTGYCCCRLHDCYHSCASESSAVNRVLKSKLPPIKRLGEWEAEKSLAMRRKATEITERPAHPAPNCHVGGVDSGATLCRSGTASA
jgi:hypothetical protein